MPMMPSEMMSFPYDQMGQQSQFFFNPGQQMQFFAQPSSFNLG